MKDTKLTKKAFASFEFGEDKLYWKLDDIEDFNDFITMCKLIVSIKNKDKKEDIKRILD